MNENEEYKEIKYTITRLLARREHSCHELALKLKLREFDTELVAYWLKKFAESDIQSDQRFAEMLVRSKINKGAGELGVKNEFRIHCIDEDIVKTVLEHLEIDWFEQAVNVLAKKIGNTQLDEPKVYQKYYRFMLQRGFTAEQIHYAMGVLKG
jgi:regulatory protein